MARSKPGEPKKNPLDNLRTQMPIEERREMGRKGGLAAAEKRLYNKSFKLALEWALEMPAIKGNPTVDKIRKEFPGLNNRDAMAISAVAEALLHGNMKAFEAVRDTVGEAPRKQISLDEDAGITINIKTVE